MRHNVNSIGKMLGFSVACWLCCVATGAASAQILSDSTFSDDQAEAVSDAAQGANPYKGIWKKAGMMNQGNKQAIREPSVHYKFYGDETMLSLWVDYDDDTDVNVSLNGAYGDFAYLPSGHISEGIGSMPAKIGEDSILRITWHADRMPDLPMYYYDEDWKQVGFPSGLASLLGGVCDSSAEGPFAGVWKVRGVRHPLTGALQIPATPSYKIYGNGYFLVLVSKVRDSKSWNFVGRGGTFEMLSDNKIKERGGKNNVNWLSKDSFEMTWGERGNQFVEVWERAEMPDGLGQVLAEVAGLLKQTPVCQPVSSDKVFEAADILPKFPGGIKDLQQYLASHIKYPEACVREKVEGRVMVSFVVKANGRVSDVKAVGKRVDRRLEREAIRVVGSLPRWNPGRKDGQPVAVKLTLPVNFKWTPALM